MRKLIFGLTAILAFNTTTLTFAAGYANASNIPRVAASTLDTTAITSRVKVGADSKSTNYLSVISGNNDGNTYYSPTGELALENEIYIQGNVSNLNNVKVVTLNGDYDTSDWATLQAIAASTSATSNFGSAANRTTEYTVDYANSFESNGIYFQYLLDMDTNTVYKTYYKDGTRASYRVIKTADIDLKTMAELESSSYTPSGGYLRDDQLAAGATRGKVQLATTTDPSDPNFALDPGRNPVSGDTVYRYIQELQFTDARYDGVIGPEGTAKAEDRAVTGRTVYEYVENRVSGLEEKIEETRAGVAMGVAMANIPDNFREGDLNMFGIGAGYYAGHSAVALGYQRRFSDNSMTFKVSAGFDTKGAFSIGTGAAMSW